MSRSDSKTIFTPAPKLSEVYSEDFLCMFTEVERAKLGLIRHQRQRNMLVSSLLKGERIPDQAWTPLPPIDLEGDETLAALPSLSDYIDPLLPDKTTDNLDLEALMIRTLQYCIAFGELGLAQAFDECVSHLQVYLQQTSLEEYLALERKVLREMVIPGQPCGFALFPFLFACGDTNTRISITMDLATTLPSHKGDLEGVSRLIELARREPGGLGRNVLNGLFALGDRRVNSLLKELLPELDSATLVTLAGVRADHLYSALLDLKLDWLDDLLRDGHGDLTRQGWRLTATLLHSLALAPTFGETDLVHEVEREIPLEGPNGRGVRVVRSWTRREYIERLESRLLAMGDRVSVRDWCDFVMEVWRSENPRETVASEVEIMTRMETTANTGSCGSFIPKIDSRHIVFGKLWYQDAPNDWAYLPEAWAWAAWRYQRAKNQSRTWKEFIAEAGDYGKAVAEWYADLLMSNEGRKLAESDSFDGEYIASVEWDYDLGPSAVHDIMEACLPEELLEMAIVRESNVHGDRFVQFDSDDHEKILAWFNENGYSVRHDQHLVSCAEDQDGTEDPEEYARSEYLTLVTSR